MRYSVILLFWLLPSLAVAQNEDADPVTECAAVLAAPPFVDMLTKNEGKDFHDLSVRTSGRALLGLECSVDELTEFFENAGWEFRYYEEQSLNGPFGVPGAKYYTDASAAFCLKRPTILGMFGYRCRPMATILFHDGKISSLIVIMNK